MGLLSGLRVQSLHNHNYPNRIECVDEKILVASDIIGFTTNAIYCVEPLANEPVVTFNLYGETAYHQRFEFNPITHQAENF